MDDKQEVKDVLLTPLICRRWEAVRTSSAPAEGEEGVGELGVVGSEGTVTKANVQAAHDEQLEVTAGASQSLAQKRTLDEMQAVPTSLHSQRGENPRDLEVLPLSVQPVAEDMVEQVQEEETPPRKKKKEKSRGEDLPTRGGSDGPPSGSTGGAGGGDSDCSGGTPSAHDTVAGLGDSSGQGEDRFSRTFTFIFPGFGSKSASGSHLFKPCLPTLASALESASSSSASPSHLPTAAQHPQLPLPTSLVLDSILLQEPDYAVFASSAHPQLVVKVVSTSLCTKLQEVHGEADSYHHLWRTMPELAEKVVVRYGGFYKCGEEMCALVVERGEPIGGWADIEGPETITSLLALFHQTGYLHGDVAPRNIVKTPRGPRFIDLGRSFPAIEAARSAELKELRDVLDPAVEKFFVSYRWARDL
ncbi:hypothetical protein JCM6882_005513 [Rhodosporidiobolus microsporus]